VTDEQFFSEEESLHCVPELRFHERHWMPFREESDKLPQDHNRIADRVRISNVRPRLKVSHRLFFRRGIHQGLRHRKDLGSFGLSGPALSWLTLGRGFYLSGRVSGRKRRISRPILSKVHDLTRARHRKADPSP
jgi:hypothetical protein